MMICQFETIGLGNLGIDIDAMCDSHAADLIYAIAERKNLPARVLTPGSVLNVCEQTYLGIHPDHREELLMLTMSELDRRNALDTDDHAAIIDAMQDVAARHQYATAESD